MLHVKNTFIDVKNESPLYVKHHCKSVAQDAFITLDIRTGFVDAVVDEDLNPHDVSLGLVQLFPVNPWLCGFRINFFISANLSTFQTVLASFDLVGDGNHKMAVNNRPDMMEVNEVFKLRDGCIIA